MRGVGTGWGVVVGLIALLLGGCGREEGPVYRAGQGSIEQTLPNEFLVTFLTVADADQDGRADILAVGHGKSLIRMFYQDEPRSFRATPSSELLGFHPNRVGAVDGHPGLYLAAAEGSHRLMVLRSEDSEGLREVAARQQAASRAALAFDWPGWGTSVVVTPYLGHRCSDPDAQRLIVYKGFDLETAKAEGVGAMETSGHCVPGRVTKGDIDGDGIEELFFTTMRSGGVWVVRHSEEADAVPQPELLGRFETAFPRMVLPADLDRDGDLDLLVPLTGRKRLLGWINDGTGTFSEGPLLRLQRRGSPTGVDFGVEGDTSVVAVGGQDRVVVFRFSGDDLEDLEQEEFPIGAPLNDFVLDDLDGDGWLDLVIAKAKQEGSLLVVYGPLRRTEVDETAPPEAR